MFRRVERVKNRDVVPRLVAQWTFKMKAHQPSSVLYSRESQFCAAIGATCEAVARATFLRASFSGVLARQQRSTAKSRPSPSSSLVRHDSARVTQGTKVPSPVSLRFFVQRKPLITRIHNRQRRRRVASHPAAPPPSRDAGEIHLEQFDHGVLPTFSLRHRICAPA